MRKNSGHLLFFLVMSFAQVGVFFFFFRGPSSFDILFCWWAINARVFLRLTGLLSLVLRDEKKLLTENKTQMYAPDEFSFSQGVNLSK